MGGPAVAAAAKQGFERAIVPVANRPKKAPAGIEIVGMRRLGEALDAAI